jgi:hypothetical protein
MKALLDFCPLLPLINLLKLFPREQEDSQQVSRLLQGEAVELLFLSFWQNRSKP